MTLKCILGWHTWDFVTGSPLGERYNSKLSMHIFHTAAFLRCSKCRYSRFEVVPGNWSGNVERKDSELETLRKMSGLNP